jgi:hypothetical protein
VDLPVDIAGRQYVLYKTYLPAKQYAHYNVITSYHNTR